MRSKLGPSGLLPGLTLVLALVLFCPACGASSLGLAVHVVPLDADGGNTVRAHFSVIAAGPCPSVSGLCSAGEDCLVHDTSVPFTGAKPGSGWCVRQWQKTVPSEYNATIDLGSNTEIYVSMNARPKVRQNSGRLNQPAYVGLPPPLRGRAGCPHHFPLSVKDLDGDRVTCRLARPDQGECVSCPQHAFIELDEEKCTLSFTGDTPVGQYSIYLMAEDLMPDSGPLSSVPVHLSLTVEESTSSCLDEPTATGDTPQEDTTLFVLPYQQVQFDTVFTSQRESVAEIAVIGPPELHRVGFTAVGPLAAMTVAWIRSENLLPRLLPVCFVANTNSWQSEPRCVWLYQRQTRALPAGTVLTCEEAQMNLVLPVASLGGVDLAELQLNSATCPVTYNSTHLTAVIPLSGCGTKAVHSGSDLVYTNTLQSVRPFTVVSRHPSLVLPLVCRIPGVQARGPQYRVRVPTEKESFGEVTFWLEVHPPGQGPLGNFTRVPRFRSLQLAPRRARREAAAVGSRLTLLDLQVMSNSSTAAAEMLVGNCRRSETEDFAESTFLLENGCSSSNSTLEVLTEERDSRVYRLDLSSIQTQGTTMYVECTASLCIPTSPSQKCPDLCAGSVGQSVTITNLFTKEYTVRSGPVSLLVGSPTTASPAPASSPGVTPPPVTAAPTAAPSGQSTTSSRARERASAAAAGVVLTAMSIFLQHVLH
ncbi:uncharacterized protein LOC119199623 [Pungitius pungitius]|uniref:uncharacterized protein LOC119199623 n=1 Tax=Pungitius pungitius TaxID=134920 RepID=UPI002E0FF847